MIVQFWSLTDLAKLHAGSLYLPAKNPAGALWIAVVCCVLGRVAVKARMGDIILCLNGKSSHHFEGFIACFTAKIVDKCYVAR